jgi:hypothetical protein
MTVRYDCMRKVQTVQTLADTFDVESLWLEAVAAGLANRLAKKWNPQRVAITQPDADESYRLARRAGSGSSQVVITCRGFGAPSRTRRR